MAKWKMVVKDLHFPQGMWSHFGGVRVSGQTYDLNFGNSALRFSGSQPNFATANVEIYKDDVLQVTGVRAMAINYKRSATGGAGIIELNYGSSRVLRTNYTDYECFIHQVGIQTDDTLEVAQDHPEAHWGFSQDNLVYIPNTTQNVAEIINAELPKGADALGFVLRIYNVRLAGWDRTVPQAQAFEQAIEDITS